MRLLFLFDLVPGLVIQRKLPNQLTTEVTEPLGVVADMNECPLIIVVKVNSLRAEITHGILQGYILGGSTHTRPAAATPPSSGPTPAPPPSGASSYKLKLVKTRYKITSNQIQMIK